MVEHAAVCKQDLHQPANLCHEQSQHMLKQQLTTTSGSALSKLNVACSKSALEFCFAACRSQSLLAQIRAPTIMQVTAHHTNMQTYDAQLLT